MDRIALDFQQIYADYRPRIQRYLARMVGDVEAEDLTQEVFVRVHRSLGTFRGDSQLSSWIYRIARNAALDRLRSPAFTNTAADALPEDSETGEILLEDRDAWCGEEAPSLEQQLFRKERFACFCDFIQSLPANYRAVVALSELEELAAGEIAGLLGLSVDVVKVRLHRGRVRLFEELKSHCKPEDWL
jgi:RNA polymerase sigma-70 factor, ECF subfamily